MPFDNTPEPKSRPLKVVVNLLRIAEAIENDVLKQPYDQESCARCAQAYAVHLGIPFANICQQLKATAQWRLERVVLVYGRENVGCQCDMCKGKMRHQPAHEAIQYLLFGSNRKGENRTRREAVALLRDVARLIEARRFVTVE